MFAKNTSPKTMGIGDVTLVPGAADELPQGYDEKHPTIKFYIKKGWLTPADNKSDDAEQGMATEEAAAKTAAEEAANKAAEEAKLKAEADALAAEKAEKLEAALKEINKMNLEPLREEAAKRSIEFTADDTKDILKQKITEKLQAELG